MRLEATVPDSHGRALEELAHELGLSRSQLIDEAVALFLKAVLELRRGRRLVILGGSNESPACEMTTPTLVALEWERHRQTVHISPRALDRVAALLESPPAPTEALRRAIRRQSRRA